MATVDLTLEQILDAVEQLSPVERKRLQRELTRWESSNEPEPRMRMPRRRTKRMSELLLGANAGTLSAAEDVDLNALVDEFEALTLATAKSWAQGRDAVNRKSGSKASKQR